MSVGSVILTYVLVSCITSPAIGGYLYWRFNGTRKMMTHSVGTHGFSDKSRARRKRVAVARDASFTVRELDLPPAGTMRWSAKRKAMVVAAVKSGILMLSQACQRYSLTPEEFEMWEKHLERFGPAGLRATHAQQCRDVDHQQHGSSAAKSSRRMHVGENSRKSIAIH